MQYEFSKSLPEIIMFCYINIHDFTSINISVQELIIQNIKW